jgi:HEPN domain-containing protein/predicted nucleotidyltransferase
MSVNRRHRRRPHRVLCTSAEPGVFRPLAHLPPTKQRQLRAIVRIIRATADIERAVLFGSHARGDWVEDPATGFMSDYDLLVLVASPALAADEALWARCHDHARDAAGDIPVSLLVHTVAEVNEALARGNSFFRDVIAEGIVLHDASRLTIAKVQPLTPAQHHALAEAAFPRYVERAAQRYASFEHSLAHGWHAIAAFDLHQTAETLHKAVLLVFTAYLPKSHDLAELERLCARACPDLGPLVPHDAPDRARLAALLRAAYIDARYSLAFDVSRQDTETLTGHIRAFRVRAERACRARIASLAAVGSQDVQENNTSDEENAPWTEE